MSPSHCSVTTPSYTGDPGSKERRAHARRSSARTSAITRHGLWPRWLRQEFRILIFRGKCWENIIFSTTPRIVHLAKKKLKPNPPTYLSSPFFFHSPHPMDLFDCTTRERTANAKHLLSAAKYVNDVIGSPGTVGTPDDRVRYAASSTEYTAQPLGTTEKTPAFSPARRL